MFLVYSHFIKVVLREDVYVYRTYVTDRQTNRQTDGQDSVRHVMPSPKERSI